jgi:transposase
MSMVCGLDLHRQQITFDALEVESGEVWRGRLWQPDRERFRRWLRQDLATRADGGPVAVAVEGCTGWRYVVEEITAAGFEAHLAEPADTQAARGRKRHAKTDRSDSRLLRELLQTGDLPE